MDSDTQLFFKMPAITTGEHKATKGVNPRVVALLHSGHTVDVAKTIYGSHAEALANAQAYAAMPELLALALRVANLNKKAGEIGAGMLAQLIDEAAAALQKAQAPAFRVND